MDPYLAAILADYFISTITPGLSHFVAIPGQTDFDLPSSWNTTYDVPIAYVNGNRRVSGTTWVDSDTVRISPAASGGDRVTILASPGAGAGYLARLGSSLLGDLDAGGYDITNLGGTGAEFTAASRAYVDARIPALAGVTAAFLRRDGANTPSANLPMGGFVHTGLPVDAISISAGTDDSHTISRRQVRDLLTGSIPIGVMMDYGGSTAPTGWLFCDGAAVSRTTYAALFAILGTVYGAGDESTTFNLPDRRGRVSIGAGAGLGDGDEGAAGSAPSGDLLTARSPGEWFGAEEHTLVTDETPAHDHDIPGTDGDAGGSSSFDFGGSGTPGTITTTSVGGDQPHNNVQPGLVSNVIIRAA